MLHDMHVHTIHSPDARTDATMEAYAERAIELGYAGIGFSDHLEFDPDDEGYGFLDYDRYSRDIDAVRRKFDGRLSIYKGVEVSYQSEFHNEPGRYLKGKDFDFVIGAVHFVGRCPFHHGDRFFNGKKQEETFRPYYEEVLRAVESGYFDVIGHLDHLKRYSLPVYGTYAWEPYTDQIEKIFEAIIQSGMALEINASGFRQTFAQPFPEPGILDIYARLGGNNITLGSDSHGVGQFGTGMKESAELAGKAGIKEALYFSSRRGQRALLG